MPIKIERTTNPDTGKPMLNIQIDNGDLGGFDDAKTKWTFKDEASMLRYTIAVLLQSQNKKLYVDDANGKKSVLEPIDSLLADKEASGDSDNDHATKSK